MSSSSGKIRIQPSEERSFGYKATLSLAGAGGAEASRDRVLEPRYLYAQGDLAVFLEDLGARRNEIGDLLDRLDRGGRNAEIVVAVADGGTGIESLWCGSSGRAQTRND